ncbi:MAG: NYN domain-containing protein [Erysipelotrichaceae bacterium]|nr:NYN domain-containing protein [Erysipelotrichaceae bacterium]
MKNITIGILAHVDAGKTTLIESMLYLSHAIRRQGRVDHQDSLLDFDDQERKRGITIYAKQASFEWNGTHIDVIDTPGHADFSAEMERSLSVLNAAVLLVSALDGVQSHTKTIWKCLEEYHAPAVFFVNKMDAAHLSRAQLLSQIQTQLSSMAIDLEADDLQDQLAMVNEEIMNEYLETGSISESLIQDAFLRREFFPVCFGSALKNEGVEELMNQLTALIPSVQWPEDFGARIFKVSEDEQGKTLAHLKITGGSLKIRDNLTADEKADQIRIYNGARYQTVTEIQAGRVCAVKGMASPHPGQGLGFEKDEEEPLLHPALNYSLILPDKTDPVLVYGKCRVLAMEDPSLDFSYEEASRSITVKLMGNIQMEILQHRIEELCQVQVGFSQGKVVFMETLDEPVYGYGHFEPLRHYAEVHLLLEPLPRGSGLKFKSACSRDLLAVNWQNLIMTHLQEKKHKGVLTGSAVTDLQITLIAGKAHNKHTEGGDFRQATYRAVRQGLKSGVSRLLEPYYRFSLVLDSDYLSKAMFDLETRKCSIEVNPLENGSMEITGRGPVRLLMNYQNEVNACTRGNGRFFCQVDGYDDCVDAAEIIEEQGYDSELDRYSPTGSVFCVHGSGSYVPWDEVPEHLHVPIFRERDSSSFSMNTGRISEEQMKEFFQKAGGQNRNAKKEKEKAARKPKKNLSMEPQSVKPSSSLPECLIVDGYNMIYGWPSLKQLASQNLFAAREELISELINYQGMRNCSLIIVFDGNRKKDNTGSSSSRGNASIVYTSAGQTADSWIEKKVSGLKGKFQCTVATSDSLIQNSALASGAARISARELESRVSAGKKSYREWMKKNQR